MVSMPAAADLVEWMAPWDDADGEVGSLPTWMTVMVGSMGRLFFACHGSRPRRRSAGPAVFADRGGRPQLRQGFAQGELPSGWIAALIGSRRRLRKPSLMSLRPHGKPMLAQAQKRRRLLVCRPWISLRPLRAPVTPSLPSQPVQQPGELFGAVGCPLPFLGAAEGSQPVFLGSGGDDRDHRQLRR